MIKGRITEKGSYGQKEVKKDTFKTHFKFTELQRQLVEKGKVVSRERLET